MNALAQRNQSADFIPSLKRSGSQGVDIPLLMEKKIGEGHHREVFCSGAWAVKVLKPFRVKKRWFRTVRLPLSAHVREKHGIEDFNRHEYENYLRLAAAIPASLRDLFNTVHWAGHYQGLSISVSDLVVNDDGSLAESLAESGVILDERFWDSLNEMEDLLLCSKMFFTGISADNILVRTRQGLPQPVFVDYKWLGPESYPCQFWLRWGTGLQNKLRRKFQRIRDLYQP